VSFRGNVSAAVVASGLVLLSTPAFAYHAAEEAHAVRVTSSGKLFIVEDIACDDQAVKGKYRYVASSTAPHWELLASSGCGTETRRMTDRVIHGHQPCVVYDWSPDNCGAWRYWSD
jgi:hypothetical protein